MDSRTSGRVVGLRSREKAEAVSKREWSVVGLFVTAVTAAGRLNVPATPLPEVRSDSRLVSLTLHATVNSEGRDTFAYNGKNLAPVIRIFPGDTLKIAYKDDLSVHA